MRRWVLAWPRWAVLLTWATFCMNVFTHSARKGAAVLGYPVPHTDLAWYQSLWGFGLILFGVINAAILWSLRPPKGTMT